MSPLAGMSLIKSILVALMLFLSMNASAELKDVVDQVIEEEEEESTIVIPHCEPACGSTEFCNFLGKCEAYPILIAACDVGTACGDECHCTGGCMDGVCMSVSHGSL